MDKNGKNYVGCYKCLDHSGPADMDTQYILWKIYLTSNVYLQFENVGCSTM